jgi:hypothetical protein
MLSVKIRLARRLLGILMGAFIAGNSAPLAARSISDIPAARESLRNMVSPRFYKSLLISPVEAYIVVRGDLANDHLVWSKIVHSESNGAYDALALELANNLQILNGTQSDTTGQPRRILVTLLVYQIADGKMAISFAHFDESGGSQLRYSGAAWMAALKGDKWVTIDPIRLSPHERRGPRTYTMAIETPNGFRSLYGNGRPPVGQLSVNGARVSAAHEIRPR